MFVMIDDEQYIDDSRIVRIENIGRNETSGELLYRITLMTGEIYDIESYYLDDITGRSRIVSLFPV